MELRKVAEVLVKAKYAIALTGAGVSTESGIPDFRGPNGIWTRNPEAERRAYEIYHVFLRDPVEYWKETLRSPFREAIEKAKPNPSHYALAELERMGILKAIITQNIDNLHQKAGSRNVIDFHGNIYYLRCLKCGSRYRREEFDLSRVEEGLIPYCYCGYPLKSDVVYFGEPIPRDVYEKSLEEVERCDLMIVAGTSAVVYPAAQLPRIAKSNGAVIVEVNAEPTPVTEIADYSLRGRTGEILPKIVEEVRRIRSSSQESS
ncbi:MAG: NAD-dependent deacylase [Archaeoglobaceae archaeon]